MNSQGIATRRVTRSRAPIRVPYVHGVNRIDHREFDLPSAVRALRARGIETNEDQIAALVGIGDIKACRDAHGIYFLPSQMCAVWGFFTKTMNVTPDPRPRVRRNGTGMRRQYMGQGAWTLSQA